MKVSIPEAVTAKILVLGDAPVSPKNHYEGYFSRRLVSVLITRRRENGSDQIAKPKTPREKFHNEYQVFTAQNFESLPQ